MKQPSAGDQVQSTREILAAAKRMGPCYRRQP